MGVVVVGRVWYGGPSDLGVAVAFPDVCGEELAGVEEDDAAKGVGDKGVGGAGGEGKGEDFAGAVVEDVPGRGALHGGELFLDSEVGGVGGVVSGM